MGLRPPNWGNPLSIFGVYPHIPRSTVRMYHKKKKRTFNLIQQAHAKMSATRCRPKLQGVQLPYSIQLYAVVFINYRYVFVIRDAFAREVLGVAELG